MTNFSASIQEIRTTAVAGASQGRTDVAARRGIEALADVCSGLFGGRAVRRSGRTGRMLDETVEIVISRPAGARLAAAA